VDPLEHYAIRFLPGGDGSFDKGTVFGADEKLAFATLGIEIPLWAVFEVEGPTDPEA
jgi:hypothetical protein